MSLPWLLFAFLMGFGAPPSARKILKAFPADAGTTFAHLLKPTKLFMRPNAYHSAKYIKLYKSLFWRCFMSGLVFTACFCELATPDNFIWIALFLWMVFTLVETDERAMLLPDVLTIPLLITGMLYASFAPEGVPRLNAEEAAIGAAFGYLLPTASSAIMSFFKPNTMGGGDVKILCAFGAWLGIYYLALAVIISFVIFAIFAIIRRKNAGPYGVAIAIAAVISMICYKYSLLAGYI